MRMSLEKIGTIKQLLAQQRVQMIEKSTGVYYFPDAPAVYNLQLKNKTKRQFSRFGYFVGDN